MIDAALRALCLLALSVQTILPAAHPQHAPSAVPCAAAAVDGDAGVHAAAADAAAEHDAFACPVCAAARAAAGALDTLRAAPLVVAGPPVRPAVADVPWSAPAPAPGAPRAPPLLS